MKRKTVFRASEPGTHPSFHLGPKAVFQVEYHWVVYSVLGPAGRLRVLRLWLG